MLMLALDTADCLPIRIPAKWLTLLRCHCIPDRSRAQLRSTPEYGQTAENRYKLTSLLKGVLAFWLGRCRIWSITRRSLLQAAPTGGACSCRRKTPKGEASLANHFDSRPSPQRFTPLGQQMPIRRHCQNMARAGGQGAPPRSGFKSEMTRRINFAPNIQNDSWRKCMVRRRTARGLKLAKGQSA